LRDAASRSTGSGQFTERFETCVTPDRYSDFEYLQVVVESTTVPQPIQISYFNSAPHYFHKINIKYCTQQSRDSSVGIAMDYGFDSRRRLGIFLFTIASRTALKLIQPPIQWVPETLSLGVKRPGREAAHSPPSSAEVNE